MALPTIATPTYTLKVPSTNKSITRKAHAPKIHGRVFSEAAEAPEAATQTHPAWRP